VRNNSRAGVTCRLMGLNVLLCRIIFYSDIKISLWFYCVCAPPPHCINPLVQKLISGAVFGTNTHKIRDKNHKERTTDLYKNGHILYSVCCVVRKSNPAPCDKACTSFGAKWLTYFCKMVTVRIYEMELTQAALIL